MIEAPIVCIVGPSGVGKTTIVENLNKQFKVPMIVSDTTREARANEEQGVDYNFISQEEFERRRDAGEYVECVEFYGNGYGLSRLEIEAKRERVSAREIHSGFATVVVNREGVEALRETYGDESVIAVLVLPPTYDDLRARLLERAEKVGQTKEDVDRRLRNVIEETQLDEMFDLVVVNRQVKFLQNVGLGLFFSIQDLLEERENS